MFVFSSKHHHYVSYDRRYVGQSIDYYHAIFSDLGHFADRNLSSFFFLQKKVIPMATNLGLTEVQTGLCMTAE